jgi:hypothetical protein
VEDVKLREERKAVTAPELRHAARTMTPTQLLTLHGPDPPAPARRCAKDPASKPSVSAAAAHSLLSPCYRRCR